MGKRKLTLSNPAIFLFSEKNSAGDSAIGMRTNFRDKDKHDI